MALFVLREGFQVQATDSGGRVVHRRTGDALDLSPAEVQLLARATAGGIDSQEPGLRPLVKKLAGLGLLVPVAEKPAAPVGPEPKPLPLKVPEPAFSEQTIAPMFRADLQLARKSASLYDITDPTASKTFTLYDFELSIARMLDGRRSCGEVVAAGQRLGIPINLESLSQFLRQLRRYGFIAAEGVAKKETGIWTPPNEKWDQGLRMLFQSGLKMSRQGRYAEAVGYFEAMLAQDPDNPEALEMLAQARQRMSGAQPVADSSAIVETPGFTSLELSLDGEDFNLPDVPAGSRLRMEPPGGTTEAPPQRPLASPQPKPLAAVESPPVSPPAVAPPPVAGSGFDQFLPKSIGAAASAVAGSPDPGPAIAPSEPASMPALGVPSPAAGADAPAPPAPFDATAPEPPAAFDAPDDDDDDDGVEIEVKPPSDVLPDFFGGFDSPSTSASPSAPEEAGGRPLVEVRFPEPEPKEPQPMRAAGPRRSTRGRTVALGLGLAAICIAAAGWFFCLRDGAGRPVARPVSAAGPKAIPAAAKPDAEIPAAQAVPTLDAGASAVARDGSAAAVAGEAPSPDAGAQAPISAVALAPAADAGHGAGEESESGEAAASDPAAKDETAGWASFEVAKRGRVKMCSVAAPADGTVAWVVSPKQRVRRGQEVGALAPVGGAKAVPLSAPCAGMVHPKVEEAARARKGEPVAELLYHEGYLQTVVTGARPAPSWSCEVTDEASGKKAPCTIKTAVPRGKGFFLTAVFEPTWFDTAERPLLKISPPGAGR